MASPSRLSLLPWLAALASALCVGAASGAALRPAPGETTEPPTPQLLNPGQTDIARFDPRTASRSPDSVRNATRDASFVRTTSGSPAAGR